MTRIRLPDRRPIWTRIVEFAGMVMTLSLGWGEEPGESRNGAAIEVFIKLAKGGSMLAAMLEEIGFLISQCRRAGVPISRLQGGMQRDDQGRPETPIGSVLDAMTTE